MEIAYTEHARLRMSQRSIPEQVIATVLEAPDRLFADGDEIVAEKVLEDGKPWRVVYAEEHSAVGLIARVVTVHRIKKLVQP